MQHFMNLIKDVVDQVRVHLITLRSCGANLKPGQEWRVSSVADVSSGCDD